jgi:hypothetical protein
MNFARELGLFGLLHVVSAWILNGTDNDPTNAGAPAKKTHGLRRTHGSLSPRLKGLLNNSLFDKRADRDPAPLHLRQPKLPTPAEDLPEVLRKIRCCNGFASFYSLGVFHRETEIIHGIAYGQCDERNVAIRVGDPIQLQVDDKTTVTFLDSNMIETSDLLLLVAYRSFTSPENELQFKSHIYKHRKSDDKSASVVTMNLFDGGMFHKGVNMEISDDDKAKTHRSEVLSDMQRDAEVSVHPGKYTIFLTNDVDKHEITEQEFVAKKNGMYTVLRIGSSRTENMDTTGEPDFPDRLVVYPRDSGKDLGKSASCKIHSTSTLLLVITFCHSRLLGYQ